MFKHKIKITLLNKMFKVTLLTNNKNNIIKKNKKWHD